MPFSSSWLMVALEAAAEGGKLKRILIALLFGRRSFGL
jgi:hypothetical protein